MLRLLFLKISFSFVLKDFKKEFLEYCFSEFCNKYEGFGENG